MEKNIHTQQTVQFVDGTGGKTFSSDDEMTWKVLNIDKETGTIELMAADDTPQYVTFNETTGFINAEDVLNDISKIYGYGKGAIEARSLTVDDVDNYSGFANYDKTKFFPEYFHYGNTNTYTSGRICKQIRNSNGEIIGYDTTVSTASESNPINIENTAYDYIIKDQDSDNTNTNEFDYAFSDQYYDKNITNMFVVNTKGKLRKYWLASRCAYKNDSNDGRCVFAIRKVGSDQVGFVGMFDNSDGHYGGWSNYVCPVVKLDNTIQMEKNSNGEWELK